MNAKEITKLRQMFPKAQVFGSGKRTRVSIGLGALGGVECELRSDGRWLVYARSMGAVSFETPSWWIDAIGRIEGTPKGARGALFADLVTLHAWLAPEVARIQAEISAAIGGGQ